LSANELVALLDRVFARWDVLAAQHGVEKIKRSATRTWSPAGFRYRAMITPRR